MNNGETNGTARRRASGLWLAGVMVLLFAAQIAVYAESFYVEPAGDDFSAPLADIWRGEAEGPGALLMRSAQPHNYRPLQSLSMWAFGTISIEHRLFWIHVLQFTGMAMYAVAGWLWLRSAPVSRFAALCGALVLFMHPALVAPLGGIDGFASLFSTGLMWISAYMLRQWRARLSVGLPLSLLTFIIGIGFKEYALGAVPLACLCMLCFSPSSRVALVRCVIVGAAFSCVVLAIMLVRQHTIPPVAAGEEIVYLAIDPIAWMRNVVQFAAVLVFPGSTKWALLQPSALTLAITGASIVIVGLTLLAGLVRRYAHSSGESHAERIEVRRWLVFSLLGVAGASFPAVLLVHVSEMYAAGMILPLALAAALAADGFSRSGGAGRALGAFVLIGAIAWAAMSIRSKVADLRLTGAEAVAIVKQILELLPENAQDVTVAVCYPPEAHRQPKYSVFKYPDDMLVNQPQALWWLRPHRGLWLEFPTIDDAFARRQEYALIVQWNVEARRMEQVQADLSHPQGSNQ